MYQLDMILSQCSKQILELWFVKTSHMTYTSQSECLITGSIAVLL